MRRIMIIGQPGSGKSTLAGSLGEITSLPVVHMDHIHWRPGWQVRRRAEKTAMCYEVHMRDAWIFEGGHPATYDDRVARFEVMVWLDFPIWLRLWRVVKRTLRSYRRSRPDLPEDCPEQFDPEFFRWIWATRNTGRHSALRGFGGQRPGKTYHHFSSRRQVKALLNGLREAVSVGNLGISYR